MNGLALQFMNTVQQVNWMHPSWDLILALFFVIASVMYGMSLGRDRIVVILMSIYVAIAIVSYAPYVSNFVADVKLGNVFAFQVTVFVGIFALLFFLLSQSALLKTIGASQERGGTIQALILSVLHIGLLTSVVLSYLPKEALAVFSPAVQRIFVADLSKFIWITAPIVVMALTRVSDERGRRLF